MSPTSEPRLRPEVQRAANLMDRLKPGWYRRIVFKRLDMQSPCNCIGGQSGIDWWSAHQEYERQYPAHIDDAPFADNDLLDDWIAEIRARRRAAGGPGKDRP